MKPLTTKQLKAKLDRVFAKFIKARDSDGDFFTCICCKKVKSISQFNACHYHSRRYLSLRWDEKNVNGGCIHCNKYLSGNIQAYTRGLEMKYGKQVIEWLLIKKNNTMKLSRFEYQILIEVYEKKLKELK